MNETLTTFETVTCSRCGGSGNYSYCQRWGTTCFKCSGSGKTYTKRGAAALHFFSGLLSKPVPELRPGMKIKDTMITLGGSPFEAWFTIDSIEPDVLNPRVDGVIIHLSHPKYGSMSHGTPKTTIFRVAHNKEDKQAARAKALAFQATLTKQGEPRKSLPLSATKLSAVPGGVQ